MCAGTATDRVTWLATAPRGGHQVVRAARHRERPRHAPLSPGSVAWRFKRATHTNSLLMQSETGPDHGTKAHLQPAANSNAQQTPQPRQMATDDDEPYQANNTGPSHANATNKVGDKALSAESALAAGVQRDHPASPPDRGRA